MATQEELFKLSLQIAGAEKAEQLAKQVQACESLLKQLVAAQGGVGASSAQMSASLQHQASVLKGLKDQLEEVERANAKLNGSSMNSGRALMEFSRAAEDAQYGIAGVLNNIPSLVQALGGGAGLIGVISLAAVGFAQLYKHYDELAALFGGGHTKTQAEQMEELGKKTEKTAADTEKLHKYEEMRRRGKAQNEKTDEVKKVETAIDKAFSEGPIAAINKGLDKNFGKKIQADAEVSNPAVYKELEAAKKQLADDTRINKEQGLGEDDPYLAIARNRVSKAQDAANAAYAESRTKFSTDDIHRKEILKAAQANPQDFGPKGNKGKDFAKNLERAMDPNFEEEKKYEEWRLAQEEEFQGKLRAMQAEAGNKELEDDKKYDEWRIKQEEDFQSKLIKVQEDSLNEQARNAADDLLKGSKGDRFLKGTANEEDLKAEMRRRGMDADDPILRGRLKNEIEERAQKMGADEATKRGLASPDEGRDFLANELALKQFDDRKAEQDKKAGRVKDALPELGGLLTTTIKGAVVAGNSLEEAQGALFGNLADRFGKDVAESLLRESGKDARGSLIDDAVNQEPLGAVQVLQGNSALRDAIQGAVKPDDKQGKILREAERTNLILGDIFRSGGGLL